MRGVISLLAVVIAAAACAPGPTIVIPPSGPEPPARTHATPPAHPKQPEAPVDPAPPEPISDPPPARAGAPASAAPNDTADAGRDLRPTSADVRELNKALTDYISQLQGKDETSPDRPRSIRGIAETSSEIGRAIARDPRLLGGRPIMLMMRLQAIRYYERLVTDYPGWCAVPHATDPAKSTGCADEALYDLALEQERGGDVAATRGSSFRLIQDWPASRFIPSAHLALGELFLAESARDASKLVLAEQSYLQALKHPPPDDEVDGYAQLQLGRVRLRMGERGKAAKAFHLALAWAGAHPTAAGNLPVALAAKGALGQLDIP